MNALENLVEKQLNLEEEMSSLGIARYRSNVEKANLAETSPGHQMMRQAIEPLAAEISGWVQSLKEGNARNKASLVRFLDEANRAGITWETMAYIVSRRIVNAFSGRELGTHVAMSIAAQIEDAVDYARFKTEHPGLLHHVLRQFEEGDMKSYSDAGRRFYLSRMMRDKGTKRVEWGNADRAKVGMLLIDMFIGTTGWAELVTVSEGKNKSATYIQATPALAEWFDKAHARCELLSPVFMPMVMPPKPWTGPYSGGYITPVGNLKFIKTRNSNYLEELKHVDMTEVYAAVNAIQDTPWQINKGIYRILSEVWQSGGNLGGLPSADLKPIPPKPVDIDTNLEARKVWRKEAHKVHDENHKETSKRRAVDQKLWLAEKFINEDAIYFPHVLDWRGRIYPVSSFISPQGDDTGKALIHFAKGIALGEEGAYWLAVHGANCFGVDKVSYDERVQWVQDNQDKILEAAMNPLDGTRWWTDADSPYLFLAFCLEWLGLVTHVTSGQPQETFESHIQVQLDGSCNGLQNFAGMLLDERGGAAVNLVPSEKPSDIYAEVAKEASKLVAKDAAAGNEVALCLDGKLTRSIAKRNTMTVPYGVTLFGMVDQLEQEMTKQIKEGKLELACEVADAAKYLAPIMRTSIGNVVVAARDAMDWLQEAARVAAKDGLPVRWTTPMGMPVLQSYFKLGKIDIDMIVSKTRIRSTVSKETNEIDRGRQALGISPNYIHSLDAAHLMRTVLMCKEQGITSFSMIHDSYGTHAANVSALAYLLRKAFVEQYQGNVLEKFRQELVAQIPEELVSKLPPLPPSGSLELEAVLDSDYFFA